MTRLITDHRRVRRIDSEPLRQDLVSGGHTVSYLRHLVRGNEIKNKRFPDQISDRHPPVLLIHGFLWHPRIDVRHRTAPAARWLRGDPFNLGVLNVRDIRASALLIHRKVEQIIKQSGVHRIDIVGHSMGGLIGLYTSSTWGESRVRRMVMLGTPARGTWAALLGVATMGLFSASSWQLLPGSNFLQELHDGPLPHGVEFFTISAERDWLCPPSVTQLEGAHAISVPLGHSSLVMSEAVYRRCCGRSAKMMRRARLAIFAVAAQRWCCRRQEMRRGRGVPPSSIRLP